MGLPICDSSMLPHSANRWGRYAFPRPRPMLTLPAAPSTLPPHTPPTLASSCSHRHCHKQTSPPPPPPVVAGLTSVGATPPLCPHSDAHPASPAPPPSPRPEPSPCSMPLLLHGECRCLALSSSSTSKPPTVSTPYRPCTPATSTSRIMCCLLMQARCI
jgi:hypothetical protein